MADSKTSKVAAEPTSGRGLYARLWRWHFFAAFLVIPFVLWQSVTGTLYVWHEEISDTAHRELRFVIPASTKVSYQSQLDTVVAKHPGESIDRIEINSDPTRATTVFFKAPNQLVYPAFVDPYTGNYLGSVKPTHWLSGLTRSLHGGWPAGYAGSMLLELGACWSIVMILTGLYLWWPRNTKGLAGVAYPRLRSGSRVFWRDTHSVVGVYFSVIVLTFLVTAMPWTKFWGNQILKPIQQATGQVSPSAMFFGGGHQHGGGHDHGGAAAGSMPPLASLDDFIDKARAQGLNGTLEVQLRSPTTPVNVRNRLGRSSEEMMLQFDRAGELKTRVEWKDYPVIPKIVSTGVDLHEGTFFGVPNQIFNSIVSVALIWLSISGFIGWYKRRPNGGLSAPPKRELRYPKAVVATGVVLCIVLPLLGASVLGILALDKLLGTRLSQATAR